MLDRPFRGRVITVSVGSLRPGGLAAAPAQAPAPGPLARGDPAATVREAERQVRTVFKAGEGRAGLERVSASAVDREELARRSVGARWTGLSFTGRAAVTKGLRALVEEAYLCGLLRGKERRFRIFDATVNGVAILAGYQEQFGQLLDAGGLPRLLESLEAQRGALVKMRSGNP